MINNFLHKVVCLTMAFVVLFSTFSFTVETHYCGSHIIDTAIFSKAKKCGMEMISGSQDMVKKSCCKDEVEVLQGQDKLQLNTFNDLNFNTQFLITTFVYSYIHLFERLPKQIIPHKDYVPPNLIYDIQVMDATFLI